MRAGWYSLTWTTPAAVSKQCVRRGASIAGTTNRACSCALTPPCRARTQTPHHHHHHREEGVRRGLRLLVCSVLGRLLLEERLVDVRDDAAAGDGRLISVSSSSSPRMASWRWRGVIRLTRRS